MSKARQKQRKAARSETPHETPESLFHLGDRLREEGKHETARNCYEKALQMRPNFPEAQVNLSLCWQAVGNFQQAIRCCEAALRQRPGYLEAYVNMGVYLREIGNLQEALRCFEKLLRERPGDASALSDMGLCLWEMGNLQEATIYFEKALSQQPNHFEALNNLGSTLTGMGRYAEARTHLELALKIKPNDTNVLNNLAALLANLNKTGEALDWYNRTLAQRPGDTKALFGKGALLLALGDFQQGWKLYEGGIGDRKLRGNSPLYAAPAWDGKPAPGKHLLIWTTEQGLGDALQFIRYAELCRQRVGKVSVLCQKPLVRLFKGLPFVNDAFDGPPSNGTFHADEHVSVMSLPHRFGTLLQTVPANVPYLVVDPALQAKWTARFPPSMDGFKVGLVWGGESANKMDAQRSISLEHMKPWLDLQGARFYSLQKDKPADEIITLGVWDRLIDYMKEVADFADTAAIIQNLDLVITVDTSVAHLAGGLGKPVWILSRFNADWRWLQNRPTNPWYPTARIFGQPTFGDWDSVIAEVGRELAKEIAKKTVPITTRFALSPFRSQ